HNSHSDEDVISLEGIGLHSFPGTDEEKQMILAAIAKVEFKGVPNRKEIKSSSFSSLGQIANYLTSNPTYKAKIEGHTGYTATEEGAEALAMDRAKNVIAYLADKGVDGHNLTPIGVVDHDDNGDITSSADRKANRRVDIVIYK
ncbi:MAG: OmpA family protein, partial [Bacteroidia bacterium]